MTKPKARLGNLSLFSCHLPKDVALAPGPGHRGGPRFGPKDLRDTCWSLSQAQRMGNRDTSGLCDFGGPDPAWHGVSSWSSWTLPAAMSILGQGHSSRDKGTLLWDRDTHIGAKGHSNGAQGHCSGAGTLIKGQRDAHLRAKEHLSRGTGTLQWGRDTLSRHPGAPCPTVPVQGRHPGVAPLPPPAGTATHEHPGQENSP